MSKRSEPTLSSGAADVSISSIDPTISEAIRSTVAASIGGRREVEGAMEVIESRLNSFQQRFSEENGATVEQAVKKGSS